VPCGDVGTLSRPASDPRCSRGVVGGIGAEGWAELPVVDVLEVHDGLITAWRDYFDLATLQHNLDRVGQSLG
jgi:hypothetical protein